MEERIRIAIHEIGHAVVAMAYGVKLRLITVQPGKKSLGRTMVDELMEYIASKDEIVDWIRVAAGGIAAEKAAGIPEMVGCTGDIVQINREAEKLIDRMGYGKSTGLFNPTEYRRADSNGYGGPTPSVSQEAIRDSDVEIQWLVRKIEAEANAVMEAVGPDSLWKLAELLNDRVTMTGSEFEQAFLEVTGSDPQAFAPGAATNLSSNYIFRVA